MNELRIVVSLSPETLAAIAACIGAVASAESDAPISAATAPASMNGTAAPAKRGPGRPRKNLVEGPAAPPAAPAAAAAPAVPVDFLSAPAAPSAAAPDDFLSAPAAAPAPAAALDDFLSAPAAKPVTDDELQAALRAEVSRLGSSTSVIALLKSAKVAKATDIPAAQRPAFLAAVRALTA